MIKDKKIKIVQRLLFSLSSLSFCFSAFSQKENNYKVPVSPELEPYAYFSIPNVAFQKQGEAISVLQYVLPIELTGRPHFVDLKVSKIMGDTSHLSSDKGDVATCTKGKCHVDYYGIRIDKELRRQFLLDNYSDAFIREMKTRVAEKFSADPGGDIDVF